jgi:hypothetical protein
MNLWRLREAEAKVAKTAEEEARIAKAVKIATAKAAKSMASVDKSDSFSVSEVTKPTPLEEELSSRPVSTMLNIWKQREQEGMKQKPPAPSR